MTKKLYWEDPYETKFVAKVSSVKENGIVLDKTLFYPESGNQLSDKGNLKIDGYDFKIQNVVKEGSEIVHKISSELKNQIKIGNKVEGEIDWEYRYGLMKAHSSQHIFSAFLKKKFDIDTVRAILNFEEVFLQISQKIDFDQLREVLYNVNELCTSKNSLIQADIIPYNQAREITNKIRSQIPNEPEIRLIRIENLDLVCCGGTHVRNTVEIGNIFVYDFKKGTELKFYVGNKAVLNSSNNNINQINLANKLNISILKLREIVEKRLELLDTIQNDQKELSSKYLEAISKQPIRVINDISLFYLDFNIDLKILNKSLKEFPQESLLIVKMGNNKIRLLSTTDKIDANRLLQKLISKYKGKGGGSPKSAQVALEKTPENIMYEIEQLLISQIKKD
jgi:alanyl-tRNA synthetase